MSKFDPFLSPEELATEEWRPVPQWESLYAVSSLGRVKRIAGSRHSPQERILSAWLSNYGYLVVALTDKPTRRSTPTLVHRLVAAAFIGPCPVDQQVNHKDGRKTNPRHSNLEYCTIAANHAHAKRLGLHASGDRNGTRTCPASVQRGDSHWTRRKHL